MINREILLMHAFADNMRSRRVGYKITTLSYQELSFFIERENNFVTNNVNFQNLADSTQVDFSEIL